MLNFFQSLGKDIETRWAATHFDNQTLPAIACEVLQTRRPWEHVSANEITEWLAIAPSIPGQPNIDSSFGQPPVTLFAHPQFYIEALHWTTGTTLIHQHGFSGAFCVLAGSSLQSTYTFECHRRINVHMLVGALALQDVRMLRVGEVESICSGDALIHSVFHLDYPSVTLVVRTHSDIESKPQYNYLPPFLAVDPNHVDPLSKRRLQALEFLRRVDSPQFESCAAGALTQSDPVATHTLLRGLADICDPETMQRLLRTSREAHGDLADTLWTCIEESRRQRWLISARERVTSAELRYLLALLLNLRSRERILAAIHERYPERDPRAQLLDLCFTMSRSEVGVEFDDLNRSVFAYLFEGAAIGAVMESLCKEFVQDDVEMRREQIISQCHVLRDASVFRYLLAEA